MIEIAYITVDDINILTPCMIGFGLAAASQIVVIGVINIISWFKS